MSKVLGKRPEVVGSTNPRSTFHTHGGAKKLVIKNLRTTSRASDLDQYYQKTWGELENALKAVFARQQPQQPLERLYRGVEDICRHGEAKKLYEVLRKQCETYLNTDMAKAIEAEAGLSNVDRLRGVHKHWVIWNQQSVCRYQCIHPYWLETNRSKGRDSVNLQLPRPIFPAKLQGFAADQRHGHRLVSEDGFRELQEWWLGPARYMRLD